MFFVFFDNLGLYVDKISNVLLIRINGRFFIVLAISVCRTAAD